MPGLWTGRGCAISAEGQRCNTGSISGIWVIREGSGIVATGGELIDQEAGSSPGEYRGSGIRGGHERLIKAGDVVFVPPGVPHGIKQTDSIVYLNIRFELRDED